MFICKSVDEALDMLVSRRKQGADVTDNLPFLKEVIELPEALGFIYGCSTDCTDEGTPLILERMLGWSVTILSVREDFERRWQQEGTRGVERMFRTHSPVMAEAYKLLCGALCAGYVRSERPFWIDPLVQSEEYPRLVEWALVSAGAPRSRVLEEVWKINRYTDLTHWFRMAWWTAARRLGEERLFPGERPGQ